MNSMNINQLIQMIGMINDPQVALQNMIKSNPQVQPMINQIKQNGGNPTDFLKNFAKQNNIDLKPIANILSKRGIKF